jgi:hypothetical protein
VKLTNGVVHNYGSIVSDGNFSEGVDLTASGDIYNYGSITAPEAIAINTSGGGGYVYNAGTISTVFGLVDNSSDGVDVYFNKGEIVSGHFAFQADSNATIDLTNTGNIAGEIDLGNGSADLVNSGSMQGDVTFVEGTNIFDSTGGTVSGAIAGGSGVDTITTGQTGGSATGGGGADHLFSNPTQTAANNAAQTSLDGGGGVNWMTGDGAFTTFIAGDATRDTIKGVASQMTGVLGYANNAVSYANLAVGDSVAVTLIKGVGQVAATGHLSGGAFIEEDSIQNVPNVILSSGNDVVHCDGGIDRITGGAGLDAIYAGAGAGSQDTFVYAAMNDSVRGNNDAIVGFKEGVDKIDLSALGLGQSHLVIADNGDLHNVMLEQTAGTFNAATDLYIHLQTTTTAALPASDIIL